MNRLANIYQIKSGVKYGARLNPRLRNAPGRAPAFTFLAILLLLALPACKHKEAAPSNENTAGVPATPPANNQPAPAANPAPPPAPAAAQPEPPAPPQPIVVSAGTVITIRLTEQLGSKTSQAGQTFGATVDKDVIVDGQTAIPAGANVTGRVITARPAGRLAGEATLVLRLTSVNVNNVDQAIVTSARNFGPKIKAKGKVKKFFGGLAKRAEGDEREVDLPVQSAYAFTFKQDLQIQ
jgi:hypothetical protein